MTLKLVLIAAVAASAACATLATPALAGSTFANSDKLGAVCVGDVLYVGKNTTVTCIDHEDDQVGDSLVDMLSDGMLTALDSVAEVMSPYRFHSDIFTNTCPVDKTEIAITKGESFRAVAIEALPSKKSYSCVGDTNDRMLTITFRGITNPKKEITLFFAGPSRVFDSQVRHRTIRDARKDLDWMFWLDHGAKPAVAGAAPSTVDDQATTKAAPGASASGASESNTPAALPAAAQ